MRVLAVAVLSFLFATTMWADERGKLIFSDDFDRNEKQEKTDEPGNGWGTNSKSRAKGNKQVDLKDGAMRIYMHAEADHAVSVTHAAEFMDGTVELKFMLEDKADSLGLNFADLQLKEVHAGHLFKVTASADKVVIEDLKTGNMNLKYYEARKEKKLTKEDNAFIASLRKTFPVKLETGKWYGIRVSITGDKLAVALDGEAVGEFSSKGFAHPTKRMLRLAVPKKAVVDELRIYRKGPEGDYEYARYEEKHIKVEVFHQHVDGKDVVFISHSLEEGTHGVGIGWSKLSFDLSTDDLPEVKGEGIVMCHKGQVNRDELPATIDFGVRLKKGPQINYRLELFFEGKKLGSRFYLKKD